VGFIVFALGLGGLAGIAWWLVVDLPGYQVSADGAAATSERGLTDVIGGDAWFSLIGLVVGAALGWLGWNRFRRLGWPVTLLAVAAAFAAALVCWAVGYQLGPGGFESRLAAAPPGALVPIELTVRAKASLVVWPFAASIPVLLASSLGPEDHDHAPPARAASRLTP